MKLVVALGGNAILRRGERGTAEEQRAHVEYAAAHIAGLVALGHRVALTHGNGPQVGDILLRNECAKEILPLMPLDICGAESQGLIGYLIQQALENALRRAGVHRRVITLVTQTVIDPADPAFDRPEKPIGPFYTREEAMAHASRPNWTIHEVEPGRFRRVVPSPEPVRIVEQNSLRILCEGGFIVVAAGGGGIPVTADADGTLRGVEAVIDKDLTAERMAVALGADALLILTDVPCASLHYGTPQAEPLGRITAGEAERYLQEGHFPEGSMGPKVKACVRFARAGGRAGIITSLEEAPRALRGLAGTCITP
ncbi:MAG: carbamate kinase [Methanomicrobiales archaeon]|nr:carbamate kinase [Methanomicrobiales archaeon]